SPDFAKVMAAAEEVHSLSDGHFDVTSGPLIELWGFGAPASRTAPPSEADIAAQMASIGQSRHLEVGPNTLRKSNPETEIYLSSIGKGFGVDAVGDALRGLGIDDFMVEIGGDLLTAGLNPDGNSWQIGIETPNLFDSSVQRVVAVSGQGLATSGDYRNYFESNGQRYSHILDAATGRPITHETASATVITENAMLADAWATAMLILGSDTGRQLADALDLPVLFIDRDGDGFTTKASARFDALAA
ncbi:MAG: FAD:protein FMN transferase, partial [Pseudomonadota bacterium]